MRLKIFLEKLAATPRTWTLINGYAIRDSNCRCPVTAVLDLGPAGNFAASTLLFPIGEAVVRAADNIMDGHPDNIKALRGLLEKACGL